MDLNSLLLSFGLGFSIGVTLGLLGGGGSILTVPALVYLVGQPPQVAVTASLVIVGSNSLMGIFFHRATLNWRVALLFGGTGMFTSYLAAGWSERFSPSVLMVMFALLMLAVGLLMIFRRTPSDDREQQVRSLPLLTGSGAGIGLLTGLLGVGGGFLIVPALVMLLGMPMQQAVGTSLVIIAMNSLAGVFGHLGHDTTLNVSLLAAFIVTGFAGTFVGTRLSHSIDPKVLRSLFAVFIIVLAVFLLGDNLGLL